MKFNAGHCLTTRPIGLATVDEQRLSDFDMAVDPGAGSRISTPTTRSLAPIDRCATCPGQELTLGYHLSCARITASTRLRTPSVRNTVLRCTFTVDTETPRSRAITLLD